MKRGGCNHPKVDELADLIEDVPRSLAAEAAGYVERLVQFAAEYAPRGDVGRFSDRRIATALRCDSSGAAALVRALVRAGWLDEHPDPEIRLVVHDWPEHCEDTVHLRLARNRQTFADGTVPKLTRLPERDREELRRFYADLERSNAKALGERSESAFVRCMEHTAPAPAPAPAPADVPEDTHTQSRASDSEAEAEEPGGPSYATSPPLPPPREGPSPPQMLTEMPEGYRLEPILEWLKIETGLPEKLIREEWPHLMSAQNLKPFSDPRKRAKQWMLQERKRLGRDAASRVLAGARNNLDAAARSAPPWRAEPKFAAEKTVANVRDFLAAGGIDPDSAEISS